MKLRALRDKRALTQEELARAAGITVTTVARIERDEIRPRPSTRRALAAALKIDVGEIDWPTPNGRSATAHDAAAEPSGKVVKEA